MDPALRFADILQILRRHDVDLILVGGIAAVLEGAPVSTFDLDIVVRPTPENQGRLLAALLDLNARYRDPAGRHIVPDAAKLETMRIHRLMTDFGPLDVLQTIGHSLAYPDLVGQTIDYEIEGFHVQTLRLEMVILSKEQAGRDKDKAVLPILHRTLQLKKPG